MNNEDALVLLGIVACAMLFQIILQLNSIINTLHWWRKNSN